MKGAQGWVTGTCLSKQLGSELGLGAPCHSSGLSYPCIGICCLSSIFSPLNFCQGSRRAAHGSSNLSWVWSAPVFSSLPSISHRPAATGVASPPNLIAQPQTEGPATGRGCFRVFLPSGLHHCSIPVSQPFWTGAAGMCPAHRRLRTPQFLTWGRGCWGGLVGLWETHPKLLGERLRQSSQNQNTPLVF